MATRRQPAQPEGLESPLGASQKRGHFAKKESAVFGSASPEWYTPLALARDIARFLGCIDLDPCADPEHSIPATRHMSFDMGDGLAIPWVGNVFVNPPYGRGAEKWTRKFASDPAIRQAVLLIPARTETRWFAPLYDFPICFISGRLHYRTRARSAKVNNAPFPSVLVYRGPFVARFVETFSAYGPVLRRADRIMRPMSLWEVSA